MVLWRVLVRGRNRNRSSQLAKGSAAGFSIPVFSVLRVPRISRSARMASCFPIPVDSDHSHSYLLHTKLRISYGFRDQVVGHSEFLVPSLTRLSHTHAPFHISYERYCSGLTYSISRGCLCPARLYCVDTRTLM